MDPVSPASTKALPRAGAAPSVEAPADDPSRVLRLVQGVDAVLWEARLPGWAFTYVSPQVERLLGFPPSRFEGEAGAAFFASLLHPDERDDVKATCEAATRRREPHVLEYRLRDAGGRWKWVRDVVAIGRTPHGEEFSYGLLIDITRDRLAAEALREREAWLEALFEHANDPIFVYALDENNERGDILDANHAALGFYGYERGELIGMPADRLIHRHAPRAPGLRSLLTVGRVVCDSLHVAKDGRVLPVEISAQLFTVRGQRRVLVIARDTSDRLRVDAALHETHRKLVDALENTNDLFVAINTDWQITYVNRRAAAAARYAAENLVGRNVWAVFPQLLGSDTERSYRRAMAERAAVHFETRSTISGQWVEVSVYPAADGISVFARDITERRRAEQSLRTSERELAQAQRIAHVGSWSFDPATQAVTWSEEMYRIFGVDPAAFRPSVEAFFAHVPPEDHDTIRQVSTAAIEAGRAYRVDHRITRGDGATRHVSEQAEPALDDATGEVVRVFGTTLDITDRVSAAQELKLHSRVLSSMTEGVSVSDETGTIVYTNPAEDAMFGYEPGGLIGRHVSEQNAYPVEKNQRIVADVIATLQREGSWTGEWHNRRKDGSTFYTLARITAIDLGGRRHFVCVQHDITDRKRAEAALRESEARFRGFAEHSRDVLWITTPDRRRLLYVSPSYERVWGRSADAIYRDLAAFVDYIHPDDRARVLAELDLSVTGPAVAEYRIVRPDGSVVSVRDRAFPIADERGEARYYAGIAEDITAQKAAEAELRRLNETLEQRVAERTAEAEVRAAQLRKLAEELTGAEQRERKRLAQALHDGLQQLLVAARLRVDLAATRANPEARAALDGVASLLSESIEASRSMALQLTPPILYDRGLLPALEWLTRWMRDKHRIDVRFTAAPDAEPAAEQTRVLVFEAVRELLFNIAKHAGVDTATVTVDRPRHDTTRVVVADEGVGFDPATLRRDGADAPGLGLMSVRERLGFLGGSLDIRSRPGGGTSMTLLAPDRSPDTRPRPQEAPDEGPATSQPRPTRQGAVRVLLADDHKILRQGLAALLEQEEGIEVVAEASDGQMAVELARRVRPDVVVMDVTMPRMNGIEATRIITRELPGVRVVGLSMHDENDMGPALRAAGAVGYLIKGGPSESLVAAIRGATR